MSGKWRIIYVSWGEVWPAPMSIRFQTQKEAFIRADTIIRMAKISGLKARVYKER